MKLDKGKMTDFLYLPVDEAERTLEALKQAEQTNDVEAMKWATRRLSWLDDVSEIGGGDDKFYPVHLFNKAWAETIKNDPVPESIAAIIARIGQESEPEPPTAADAGKAIDTVRAFLEDGLGGKRFKAACTSLDALREAVKTAEAAK
jgi:hypothetical protein